MLNTVAIANYRSLRDVVVPFGPLTLVTGPNGSGKSNLYRALRLLVEVAEDEALGSLAREGGFASAMWAGPEQISRRMKRGEIPIQGTGRKRPQGIRAGFAGETLGYAVDLGLPQRSSSAFSGDPEVKRESIWLGGAWSRRGALIERRGPAVEARDPDGHWQTITNDIASHESMLTWAADPRATPEAFALRRQLRAWRFYDQFRTDRDAPARQVRLATRTPVLNNDGRDLAAALQTIREIGDPDGLAESLDEAFPGAEIEVQSTDAGLRLGLRQPGLLRTLDQAELSDGTLRYICWLAALHTPRPPPLMVLNEPETSLHVDLLGPLGRLIARTSRDCQVLVVSHARPLIEALERGRSCVTLALRKELSETVVDVSNGPEPQTWYWPPR